MPGKLMTRSVVLCVAASALASMVARTALADPTETVVRHAAPNTWLEPFTPEPFPEMKFPSYFNDLDKARAEVFHGRYRRALLSLSNVAPTKPEDFVAVALIRAKAHRAMGSYETAMKDLAEDKVSGDPAVQSLRIEILLDQDKQEDALKAAKELIAAHSDYIPGHYWLGAILEKMGHIDEARAAFDWFDAKPQSFLDRHQMHERTGPFESAEMVTYMGRGLDRWATLNFKYKNNPHLDKALLNLFVYAYDIIDRDYWPAHVAAGEYFMSHDQDKEAGGEFSAALKANPGDADAMNMMGMLSLAQFNFENAEKAIAAIRQVNPKSIQADLLETRNLLLQRRPELAFNPLQPVLKAQPKNIEALGLLAATYGLQLKDDKTQEILKQVDALDPHNASAYLEVAEQFSAVRQYPRSAKMFQKAIERAPWWTTARNGLGLLYTQSGDEDLAHTVLNDARELDPFNLRTTNYLKLLDMMDHFARKESDHFIIIYDPTLDPVIPEYFNEYMESVHRQICDSFKTEPPVKTMIEVFPTHDAFSVRTTGSPWIGTVGASTGRVIALVTPKDGKGTMGTYNWAQVLRHEYTHTVTLAATDNRIQHWMTEGLAVYEERTPIRWEWVPMLYNAVTQHELFPIDQLTWSFVRPKRPIDRQLAYAESYWICKYIEETYGHETILKLLKDFHDAEPQEVAFPKETHKSLPEFQKDFFAWCDKTVDTWGYDEDTSKKVKSLVDKADALVKTKDYLEALEAWKEIAKIRPVDEMPHKRLAGLYLTPSINEPEKAADELILLSLVELKDNKYAKRVARLYRDQSKWADAEKYGLLAVYTSPYDESAHELLAEIYEKAGDNPKGLEREKRVTDMIVTLKAKAAEQEKLEEKNANQQQ